MRACVRACKNNKMIDIYIHSTRFDRQYERQGFYRPNFCLLGSFKVTFPTPLFSPLSQFNPLITSRPFNFPNQPSAVCLFVCQGVAFWAISAYNAGFYLVTDYGLYWLLAMVSRHLNVKSSANLPPFMQLHVNGDDDDDDDVVGAGTVDGDDDDAVGDGDNNDDGDE